MTETNCPWCGRKLAQTERDYAPIRVPRSPDHPNYDMSEWEHKRRVVGTRPARHPYFPFDTMRCGLAFAQAAYRGGYRRMKP